MAPNNILDWITNHQATQKKAPSASPVDGPPAKRYKITPLNGNVRTPLKSGRTSSTNSPTHRGARRVAKLARLPTLPIDILFEIFGHLHPSDLLTLTRTSKALRTLLLQRSATCVWKDARASVLDLPFCPPDMSEPAYANLMFNSRCQTCMRVVVPIDNVDWELRARFCNSCAKLKIISSKETEFTDEIKEHLPIASRRDKNDDEQLYCLVDDLLDFKSCLRDLADESKAEERAAYLARKRELKTSIEEHAEYCEEYAYNIMEARRDELDTIRARRRKAIWDKLVALGYEEELRSCPTDRWDARTESIPMFSDHPLVKQPKALTERSWKNIKPRMIALMEEIKAWRLKRERDALVRVRRGTAAAVWHQYQLAHPRERKDVRVQPSPADFCALPTVKAILEAPSDTPVTAASFDRILPTLPQAIEDWQADKMCALAGLMPITRLGRRIYPWYDAAWAPENVDRALARATTIFRCTQPSWTVHIGPGRADTEVGLRLNETYQGLFYPEFVHHRCNNVHHTDWRQTEEADRSLRLGKGFPTYYARQEWCCEHLEFDDKASEVAEQVVKACGLDPKTASVDDMDKLDARLVCLKCTRGIKCDGGRCVEIRTWRNAIQHCMKKHWGDSTVQWERISEADTARAKVLEQEELQAFPQDIDEVRKAVWTCARCWGTEDETERMTSTEMHKHLRKQHGLDREQQIQGETYFRALDAPPVPPRVVKMVPAASDSSACQSDSLVTF